MFLEVSLFSLFSQKHAVGSRHRLLTSLPPDCKQKYSIQPAPHRGRGLGTWTQSQGSQRWVLTSMWGICSDWTLDLLFLNWKLPLSPVSLQQVFLLYAAGPLPPGGSSYQGPLHAFSALRMYVCLFWDPEHTQEFSKPHLQNKNYIKKKPKSRVATSYGVNS